MTTDIFFYRTHYLAIVRGCNWKIQWLNDGFQTYKGVAPTHEQATAAVRAEIDKIVWINSQPRN